MSIEIREATEAERERARTKWARIMEPPKADPHPLTGPMHRAPGSGRSVAPYLWRVASDAIVDKLIAECDILVAVLPSVPNEPVGWVAYEGDRLHMVYVLGDARRRGVGRALVEHAMMGVQPRPTYMTKPGRDLLTHIARTTAYAVESNHASARPPQDAVRASQDLVDC